VEPGSAAGVAGVIKKHAAGEVPSGKTIVITVTGHGLKDPQWALRTEDGSEASPIKVDFDVVSVASALGLE
jgi:threonine synthase